MRLSSTAGLALHAPVALLGTGLLIALGLARERPALIALGVLGSIVYAAIVLRRPLRRMRALRRPFPAPWRELLRRRIRFYERLDPAGRARFERNVTIVLADYRFEGIGVPIDDELRLLAASGAAMLIHGLEGFEYPGVRSIVLYPNHFDEAYRVGAELPIAGMVHGQGPIVFSAAALRQGFSREKDGHNVALHELAHVLDMADGSADGVPAILGASRTAPWSARLAEELLRVRKGRSPLRAYGGKSEAELFAVAVEAFFERPGILRRKRPELYAALVEMLALDPLATHDAQE